MTLQAETYRVYSLFSKIGATVVLLMASGVQAATRTWDGGAGDLLWGSVTNWSNDIMPVEGDTATFAISPSVDLGGVTRTIATLSIASASGNRTFSNGTFSLSSINAANLTGTQTFSVNLTDVNNSGLSIIMAGNDNLTGNGQVTIGNTGSQALYFNKSGTQGSLTLGSTSLSNTVAGGVYLSSGTATGVTLNGLWAIGGDLNLHLNTPTLPASGLTLNGTVSVGGNLINECASGNITIPSGTTTIGVGGDLIVQKPTDGTDYATMNITLSKALASLGGSAKVLRGTLIVNVTDPVGTNTTKAILLGDTVESTRTATISINSGAKTVNNPITVQAGSTAEAILTSGSGGTLPVQKVTYAGAVTLNKNLSINAYSSAGCILDVMGNIGEAGGSRKVTINSTNQVGIVWLSGTNSYTGGTEIKGGTLVVTKPSALPGFPTSVNVTVTAGSFLAQVGAGGWIQSQVDALLGLTSNQAGVDISNGNLDYVATNSITFASITRGTGGSLRLLQDQADRVTVSSALSGLNKNGILPWAILKTGSTVNLAVGGALGSPITTYASYQTGAETTWLNTVNARPATDQILTVNRSLGSLVLDAGIDVTGVPNSGKNLNIANGLIVQTGGSSTITPRNNTSGLVIGGSVIDTEGNLTIVGCNNDSMIAGSLTKTGPGTLYMGAVDSFSSQQMSNGGDWYLNQGLVEYSRNGGNANQGWGSDTLCFNGGNLMVHSANGSDGNGTKNRSLAFYADATFTLDNASTTAAAGTTTWLGSTNAAAHSVIFKPVTVTIAGGAHVNSGTAALVLGTTNVANHTVTLNGTPTLCITNPVVGGDTALTLNGVIGDGGKRYGLIKTGNGTLILGGTNTYTGTTEIQAGTLKVNNVNCFSDASSVSIATNAKMDLNYSGSDTVAYLYLGGQAKSPGTYGLSAKGSSYFVNGSGTLTVLNGPAIIGTIIRFY